MIQDDEARQHFKLGLVAVDAKDWQRASNEFWQAVKRAPNNVALLFNLGNARLMHKDMHAAWAIDRALSIDPTYPNLRFLAGNFCVESGQYAKAVEHFVAAVKQDPENGKISANMAEALTQLQLFEEAYECFDWAITCGTERSAGYSAMHHVAQMAGRWDLSARAQALLDEYLAQGGDNQCGPFQLLGMRSTREQQRQAAESYTIRMLQLGPVPE